MQPIRLEGACTHNLRRVDLELAPGSLVVVTGPSGAGKSSLAFATLYAEGQRRYVESFSAYARQFLERLERPPVHALRFMPAAIAVDRVGQVKTSRSTVSTLTEIADYLKQLFVLDAELTCTRCGRPVRPHSPRSAAEAVRAALPERKVVVTYPVAVDSEDDYLVLRDRLAADGYRRLWLGDDVRDIDAVRPSEVMASGAPGARAVQVVTDRTTTTARDEGRLIEAVAVAFERGGGALRVIEPAGAQIELARDFRCDGCGTAYRRPSPGLFSFNNPIGACEQCRGFGRTIGVDWAKVVDRSRSIADGALRPWSGKAAKHERKLLLRHCARAGIATDVPASELTEAQIQTLIDGDGGNWRKGYPGLRRWFAWLETRAYKMHVRVLLSRYRSYDTCAGCGGMRWKPEVLGYRALGMTLPELSALEVGAARERVHDRLSRGREHDALRRVLEELDARLGTLCDVGLSYLTLDRSARSLSGGELQRVALATALDSRLTGTLFALDEPTLGLHAADVARLLPVVKRLSAAGNVTLVVDSDERLLAAADRVVELGPGAGEHGGRVVFDGTPEELSRADTRTAQALRAARMPVVRARRGPRGALRLEDARGNNLRGVDLDLPLGVLTCVTGVSGSGKSSLIAETLVPAVQRALGMPGEAALAHAALHGVAALTRVIAVDQAPLGRTSRGNAATYLGVWDALRKRFAATLLAKERGYKPGMFSFNVAGGRCEACKGEGSETVEMQFLADVRFSCPECGGRRFVGPVLDVEVEGVDVAEALELTVDEAARAFARHADVTRLLAPLCEVGAGYLRLGQPLSTLSGGEAQRLKLAAALSEVGPGTLLVLDEPTAGLHAADVEPLLAVLDRLVDAGATVVVVEHDLSVAARADHVIDVGPGAGAAGGRIAASGTPEQVARVEGSITAPFLRAQLAGTRPPDDAARHPGMEEAPASDALQVRGAHEHNLKGIDVDVPRERLVVVTGPSGSGKSTLAFDVIFAESQRRYLETLSPYVRQYLKELPRPHVDRVDGLPPSVSLEQRYTSGAKSSTVATVTEVAHYLRLLYARVGLLHCPTCIVPESTRRARSNAKSTGGAPSDAAGPAHVPIAPRPVESLVGDVAARFGARRVSVLSAAVRAQKGSHRELLARALDAGVEHARIDGELRPLTRGLALDRYREHDVELVLGSVPGTSDELRELLRRALREGKGTARVTCGDAELLLSSERACPSCGRGFPEPDPRFFSFNTRQGACASCEGRGFVEEGKARRNVEATRVTCAECGGRRLSGLALYTTVDGLALPELMALSVDAASRRLEAIELSERDRVVAEVPLREARSRLSLLARLGLGYLGLDRAAFTLSGGEMQRVRLSGQLGSGLTGVLYVLDEPTIGLHPRDTGRLLEALRALVGQGCSVLVVEHDADTIAAADHMIDVGPTGGHGGGHILAEGAPSALLADPKSITGCSLARPTRVPAARRPVTKTTPALEVIGAREHNLRDVTLRVPLGRFVAVTGVSGSGKSTLVREVLLRGTRAALGLVTDTPGAHDAIRGARAIKRAVEIDQTPIGRTPRSVPATYVGIWDDIRRLYAGTQEARARGFGPSRFSFNVAGGRCASCEGQGALSVEMSFLPNALVACEACGGSRYDAETQSVRLHGLHVGDLLRMHVEEAVALLASVPKVRAPLQLMCDLGLSYLTLGQSSSTLSGGEAQRLKLVSELSASGAGPTLYVMDEPTTGLHREDVARLLSVMDRLVERGDTVVAIEHHLDVIAWADWVVDLGPEGGEGGGRIVAEGTPEQLARVRKSHTGTALAKVLSAS